VVFFWEKKRLGNERGACPCLSVVGIKNDCDWPIFSWKTLESLYRYFGTFWKTAHFCNSPSRVKCLLTLSHLLLLPVRVVATPTISVF
jgi:hypothetical protein